jgi:hypothetical protein
MKLRFVASFLMLWVLLVLGLISIEGISLRAATLHAARNVDQVHSVRFAGLLAFDKYTSYAKATNTAELDLQSATNGSFTVEASFRITTAVGYAHPYNVSIIRTRTGYGIGIEQKCRSTTPYTCSPRVHRYRGTLNHSVDYAGGNESGYWHHIALVNDGLSGELRLYFNGQLIESSFSEYSVREVGNLLLGCWNETCEWEQNVMTAIDEIRISNVIRYGSSFPLPTAPFTCDENTLGLWHFDEMEGATVFHDSCGMEDNFITGYNGARTSGSPHPIFLPFTQRSIQ